MSEDRKPRDADTREASVREQLWKQPDVLPEVKRQPGYSYRWVRVAFGDKPDPRNFSAKSREGYEAVKIEEQPHLTNMVDSSSRFKDNIEVDGLLLMKIPSGMLKQRTAHYAKQNQAQMESVDNSFMKESDPRMPLFKERRSKVSFGKGN